MALKTIKVSVILLTYNAQAYFEQCLASVLKQVYRPLELIIIDNHSTDQTPQLINQFSAQLTAAKNTDLKLKTIFNNQNIGFSAGHNLGIRLSQGNYLCCLNQDVILHQDFIQAMIRVLEQKLLVGAVQGKLLKANKKNIIDTTGLMILKNRRIIARGQGQVDQGQYNQAEEIFGVDGAVPVYRRSALEDIKINNEYFDENFFMYKEDVDLAWRMRLFGWQAYYQPQAIAYHWRSAGESAAVNYIDIIKERKKINAPAKYYAFKNQRLMQIKNESWWQLLLHLPWFVPKELGAWIYVLVFERYTLKAIIDLMRQLPQALVKRRLIRHKAKLRQGDSLMVKWFN